jgi:hypothetical protein
MRFADRLSPTAALRVGAAAVAAGALTAGALAVLPSAGASVRKADDPSGYVFATYDNNHDVTFNQLLGINDNDEIAGYFGVGAKGHPNKGYTLAPPYGQANYTPENYPRSKQTQVTGLNDEGVTVGFYSTMNNADLSNDNFGWYNMGGVFHEVNFPTPNPANRTCSRTSPPGTAWPFPL